MRDHMNPKKRAIKKRSGNRDPIYKVKEGDVKSAVLDWLTFNRIPHWRINSGALKTPRGRFIRFGAKGMSDIYAIGKNGMSIWIETKRPRGGVVSAGQREFLDCINRNGGIGIVVNSIESLEQQLKEAGVI